MSLSLHNVHGTVNNGAVRVAQLPSLPVPTPTPKVEAVISELSNQTGSVNKAAIAIATAAEILPTTISIRVFHGKYNRKQLVGHSKLRAAIKSGRVVLQLAPYDAMVQDPTKQNYNNMLLSEEFWGALNGEKVLLFEPDTTLCAASDVSIYAFAAMPLHYIGAAWKRGDCEGPRPYYPNCVGNSGLSLISRAKMLELMKQIPVDQTAGRNMFDQFVSRALQVDCNPTVPPHIRRNFPGCNVPNTSVANVSVAQLFSVEAVYDGTYTPLGVHKPWMYLQPPLLEKLRGRCPNIRKLIGDQVFVPII